MDRRGQPGHREPVTGAESGRSLRDAIPPPPPPRYLGLRIFLLIPFVYLVFVYLYLDQEDYEKRRRGGMAYMLPIIGAISATLTNSVPIGSGACGVRACWVPGGRRGRKGGGVKPTADERPGLTQLLLLCYHRVGVIFTPLMHMMKIDGKYNIVAYISAIQAISNGIFGFFRCVVGW